MAEDSRLERAIAERKQHAECNYDFDEDEGFTDDDAIEELMGECGMAAGDGCSLAGTEYCSFECPFS
jgi:hypothetical protein